MPKITQRRLGNGPFNLSCLALKGTSVATDVDGASVQQADVRHWNTERRKIHLHKQNGSIS